MNLDEKRNEEVLEEKETKILRLCHEKPLGFDEIVAITKKNGSEVAEIIANLKEKGLIKESEGKIIPTRDGDFYISN